MKSDWHWQSGDGTSTEIGYLNVNGQQCCGHRGVPGTEQLQHAYKVECTHCGFVYSANGSDLFERKCPGCQGGAPGIRFWQVPY